MDEGNSAAENGFEGGVKYVEKNNLGAVTTKQKLALEDMEPFQAIEKCKYVFFLNLKKFSFTVYSMWNSG